MCGIKRKSSLRHAELVSASIHHPQCRACGTMDPETSSGDKKKKRDPAFAEMMGCD
jgi:hypothetical protein